MTIIKLDAIDSTNSYLKNLVLKNDLNDYTVVLTDHQTSGRGQMGTVWIDDKGKNLIFSLLVRFKNLEVKDHFYLSMAVSLGIYKVLNRRYKNVKIKWPNDILADKDKIAGILIENSIKGTKIAHSVIGIGLNVNQLIFDASLHHVTSLKKLSGTTINREALFEELLLSLRENLEELKKLNFDELKAAYLDALFKMKVPAMFIDKNDHLFLGRIMDVNELGQLVITTLEDGMRCFDMKEIKFAPTAM